MTLPNEVSDLGEKLDHLEGIIGYRFDGLFPQRLISRAVQDLTQWNGKCNGSEEISNFELSRLVDRFELEPALDYSIFRSDKASFEAALSEACMGTHSSGVCCVHSQALHEAADRRRRIAICLTDDGWRGGIDTASYVTSDARLGIGDLAYLHAPIPMQGHLITLNDDRHAETYCSMPSLYAPETLVSGNSVQAPTVANEPYLAVSGQPGRYRLYRAHIRSMPHFWPSEMATTHRSFLPKTIKPSSLRTSVGLRPS